MIAYVSQNADNRIIDGLLQEGFEIIKLPSFNALTPPVDTHADMVLCAVDNTVFIHKDYDCKINNFVNIIRIDDTVGKKYPNDIFLNIAVVGRHVFANTKFASKTILGYLANKGFLIHHIAQGYAHCSTCIVNESAIITADIGISEEAKKAGIDVLKIDEGSISLPPYKYGFIGGSCGSYKDKIYFCGSLNYHPNGEQIKAFCQNHGKTVVELCDMPLMDVGGILFN